MRGSVEIAFTKEPDFFRAEQVHGRFTETYIIHHTQDGILAGMGTRAIKPAYLNGKKDNVGYLCNLRILPEYQKGLVLARGYTFLKQRHSDNRARLYLTTIIEDNIHARSTLESGRSSLPGYYDIGRFCTFALSLKQSRIKSKNTSLNIRRSTHKDIQQIIDFLRVEGPRKQFFPEYSQGDFETKDGILLGLGLDDIYLAFIGDQLVGVTAAWDQTEYRQSVIVGYNRMIQSFRPFINLGLGLLGYPLFPKPQTALSYFSLGLVCIKGNDADIFASLINTITSERENKYSFMMAGFHEKDPLLDILQKHKGISYSSRVYIVCWENGEKDRNQLDSRIPYLELGAL
jgi:hypothetical protein